LQFATELGAAHDGPIAALLGASPGASVTVPIMPGLIERCFPEQGRSPEWSAKPKEICPACEKELESDAELYRSVCSRCSEVLE
ncbi:malate:quinone oxidoreductase, partial [Pseudomonas aeruginosa]